MSSEHASHSSRWTSSASRSSAGRSFCRYRRTWIRVGPGQDTCASLSIGDRDRPHCAAHLLGERFRARLFPRAGGVVGQAEPLAICARFSPDERHLQDRPVGRLRPGDGVPHLRPAGPPRRARAADHRTPTRVRAPRGRSPPPRAPEGARQVACGPRDERRQEARLADASVAQGTHDREQAVVQDLARRVVVARPEPEEPQQARPVAADELLLRVGVPLTDAVGEARRSSGSCSSLIERPRARGARSAWEEVGRA